MPAQRWRALLLYGGLALIGLLACRSLGSEVLAAVWPLRALAAQGPFAHLGVAFGLFGAACAAALFAVPVAPPLCMVAGHVFGTVEGAVLCAGGGALGATLAFAGLRAHHAGAVPLANPLLTLALLRVSPWVPAPAVTLLGVASGVRASLFCGASLLGSLPLAAIYAGVAARLTGSETSPSLDVLATVANVDTAPLAVLGVVSLLGLAAPLRSARARLAQRAVSRMRSSSAGLRGRAPDRARSAGRDAQPRRPGRLDGRHGSTA